MMRKTAVTIFVCISLVLMACTFAQTDNILENEELGIVGENNSQTTETSFDTEDECSYIEGDSSDVNIYEETDSQETKEERFSFWELMNASEELEDEEREMLQRFYPIFCEQKTFSIVDSLWDESDSPVNITFDEIFKAIVPYEYENGYTELKYLEKFTLVDMTGDGKVELVLYVRDLGWNVIVFEENNGEFAAASFGYRSMNPIYSNGIYCGSGGVGTYGYYCMNFENGYLIEETLAEHDWDYDDNGEILTKTKINGQSVSAEEFYTWESENTQEEAKWNYVETTEWN